MIVEALVIGLLGSLIGLAAGYGIATGLDAVFASMGIDLPEAGTVFATRTVIVVDARRHARHARSPGLAARRGARPASRRSPRCATPRRARRRSACPARVVRLLASVIGRPAERVGGVAGRLARRNAMRNPAARPSPPRR